MFIVYDSCHLSTMEADDDLKVPGDDPESFVDSGIDWLRKLVEGNPDDTDEKAIRDLTERQDNLFKEERVAQPPVESIPRKDEENLEKINIYELERKIRSGGEGDNMPEFNAIAAIIGKY